MSPIVEWLPADGKWHDPDNDDPTSIKHLASRCTHDLGDGDATEVEYSYAQYVAWK